MLKLLFEQRSCNCYNCTSSPAAAAGEGGSKLRMTTSVSPSLPRRSLNLSFVPLTRHSDLLNKVRSTTHTPAFHTQLTFSLISPSAVPTPQPQTPTTPHRIIMSRPATPLNISRPGTPSRIARSSTPNRVVT